MTTQQSNTAEIRKKLEQAFDDLTLSAFCFDYFPKVYDSFSQGMRKDNKIMLLLAYCRRQPTGFETLLQNVRKEHDYLAQSGSQELKPLINALEVYMDSSPRIADTTKDEVIIFPTHPNPTVTPCTYCATQNPLSLLYCQQCERPLNPKTCIHCGFRDVPERATRCLHCGKLYPHRPKGTVLG